MKTMVDTYDAILLVSFGGPEGPDDVMPFLENVLRGKNVPHERMLAVAEHYHQFGGVSPINGQNRELIVALENELAKNGPQLPIYWGNRNWHPLLTDTFAQMKAAGISRALGLFTSAYSSYSGCRQYRENIEQAQSEVGEGAAKFDKIRVFFNHPGFVATMVDRVNEALEQIPAQRRQTTRLVYTAHSIPLSMAAGCRYALQLGEACRLVSEQVGPYQYQLVYQSRSGPPSQPWLEPDVCDYIRQTKDGGEIDDLVVVPIGFLSDHIEVLFDLDTEAMKLCQELGINMVRAKTPGTHPKFIRMIGDLIRERTQDGEHMALDKMRPSHDVCPQDCCLMGERPERSSAAAQQQQ